MTAPRFNDTVGWLPGSHSFIYNRLQKLGPSAPEKDREIKSRAYLHVIGTNPEHDKAVFGYGLSPLVKVGTGGYPFCNYIPWRAICGWNSDARLTE